MQEQDRCIYYIETCNYEWSLKMLVHPGTSRLKAILRQVYWWPNL